MSHEHEHHHDHFHAASREAGEEMSRDRRILLYMIDHNAEHAQELQELAGRLKEDGQAEAAAMILEAVSGFNAANETLKHASGHMK